MSDSEWYYLADSQQQGPVSLYALKGHISAAQLPVDVMVWQAGMADWVAANTIPAFTAAIPAHILTQTEIQKTGEKDRVLAALNLPLELEQKHPIHGKANYVLDAEALEITSGIGVKRKRIKVLVSSLVQQPFQVERAHLSWLGIANIFIILGVISMGVGGMGVFPHHQLFGLIGIILMMVAAGFIVYMQWAREKLLAFNTLNKPVTFWIDNPDKATFEEFLTTLLKVIEVGNRTVVVRDPVVCKFCGARNVVPGLFTPLCFACQEERVRLRVPLWLTGAAIAVGVGVMICLSQLSAQLQGDILLARGLKAEKASDYSTAAAYYQEGLKEFPHSREILFGLARSAYRSGDQSKASETVNTILKDVGPHEVLTADEMALIKEVQGTER